MKNGICLECQIDFSFPYGHLGRFCSPKCRGTNKARRNKAAWYAGTNLHPNRPTIRQYLTEDRGYRCEVCGISEWQNQPLTLEVDHINGDPSNDSPENVRLICPNCHSQSPYRGNGNRGRGRKARGLKLN